MHELGLMGDILNLINEDLANSKLKKVTEIELLVGKLSNAMPDALEMALEIYKAEEIGFLAPETKLIIVTEEAEAICVLCDNKYKPDQLLAICPNCQVPSGRIISGESFKIISYNGK
jgi:hydrogenase nickel incorporation protein HypA/HybF